MYGNGIKKKLKGLHVTIPMQLHCGCTVLRVRAVTNRKTGAANFGPHDLLSQKRFSDAQKDTDLAHARMT